MTYHSLTVAQLALYEKMQDQKQKLLYQKSPFPHTPQFTHPSKTYLWNFYYFLGIVPGIRAKCTKDRVLNFQVLREFTAYVPNMYCAKHMVPTTNNVL